MEENNEFKTICDKLDELAVNYFEVLEELSEQRRRFEKLVREGFMNLSKARFSMGNKAVGSLQYDSTSMCALAHVETRAEGDHHSFELSRTKAKNRSERKSQTGSESEGNRPKTETVARRRRPVSSEAGEEMETLTAKIEDLKTSESAETQRVPADPLLWFGVLVPQPLRHGQQNFVDAIEACTLVASLQTKLDIIHSQYRGKLRQKHDILNQTKKGQNGVTQDIKEENS